MNQFQDDVHLMNYFATKSDVANVAGHFILEFPSPKLCKKPPVFFVGKKNPRRNHQVSPLNQRRFHVSTRFPSLFDEIHWSTSQTCSNQGTFQLLRMDWCYQTRNTPRKINGWNLRWINPWKFGKSSSKPSFSGSMLIGSLENHRLEKLSWLQVPVVNLPGVYTPWNSQQSLYVKMDGWKEDDPMVWKISFLCFWGFGLVSGANC